MTNRTEEQQAIISDDEVELVNKFRDLCNELARKNHKGETWKHGTRYAIAVEAGDAAFEVLNWFTSYGGANLSDKQIYNRKED